MDWPKELNDKIIAHCDTLEEMVRDIKKLVPRKAGASGNPFFAPCVEKEKMHRVQKIRSVTKHIPRIFIPLYESYDDKTEFTNESGLVLFSEDEMRDFNNGILDFGFMYYGMGHIMVFSYDANNDKILSHIDGGANDWDRVANSRDRKEAIERYARCGDVSKRMRLQSLEEWWIMRKLPII